MSSRHRTALNLILLLTAGVFINLLGQRHKFRVDLTDDQRFTPGQATLALLQGLPEAVTVTAYFTGDLPPQLAVIRQDLKDLLTEYDERSGGRVAYEFKDPGSDEAIQAEALQAGMIPVMAQTRKQDRTEHIQVFMGAVVRMGSRRALIPALREGPGMEWTLASAIAQVSRIDKPLIGVLQGHGEPPLHALDELASELMAQYDVEATTIYDSFPINERFSSLLIIDPKDTLPAQHMRRIDEYMAKGHGVVLAYGAVETDLGRSREAHIRDVGVFPWLARHGLRIEPQLVADHQSGQINMARRGQPRPLAIPFPFFPLMDSFGDHVLTGGLELVMFQFAAPLSFIGDSTRLHYIPFLTTSAKSALVPAPVELDPGRPWSEADFRDGPQVLGAAIEPADSTAGRLVVFTNGTFTTGDQGGRQLTLPQGNLDLMVNAVDWVTHNTDLLSVRGKRKEYRPLSDPGATKRALLKWMNLLLPIVLVLLYGLFRSQWRRWQRNQRMQPHHVR